MKKELLPRFQPHAFFRQTRFQWTFTADDAQSPDKRGVVVRLFQRNKVSINILELTDRLSWYQNIRHTNLVAISEAGFTEHQDLYVVRDFIPQSDVFGKQSIDWLPQLVSVMQFLRHCRQVHGGIKPTNLFVENGILRLTDPWTAATRIDLNEDTIHYTAPELFQGCRPTLESDLYAFGCLIYRRLTGAFPFSDPHFENLLTKYLHAKPNPLVELSTADNRLAGGVQALLDKNPAKRLDGLDVLSTLFPHFDVASQSPFVGRDAELNSIVSLCSADKRRSLRIACLEGGPGIGKTRLIEEVGRRSKFLNADFINLQISKDFKVSLFAEQLRVIVTHRHLRGHGTAEQQLGTLNDFLNSFAHNETTSLESSNRDARVLGNILVTLTRRNPLVLALDLSTNPNFDLERLIEEFCYRADDLGVLLLIAFRPRVRPARILQFVEENLGERITVIQLEHLGMQDLNVLSRTVSKNVEADAIKLSGGNPLLLESYFKSSTETRKFFRRVQSSLTQIEKLVLDAASILSPDFDVSTLKALCSLHNFPFGPILSSLVERRLLHRVGDQLSFTYYEFPRFIESRLTPNHRKRLHRIAFTARQAAGVTLTDTDAYHAFRADLFSEAFDLYAGLMRKYRHAGQFSQAINCYEHALKCSSRLGRQVSPEDELEVAQCYSLVGKNEVGREICHRLLADEHLISSHLVSKIYTALALSESTGSNAQIDYFRRAISISANDSQDVISRLAQLAQSLYLRGRLKESEEIINSALSSVNASNRNIKVVMLLAVKGALEVHKSDFKSALKTLQGLRCSNLATRSGVLSNIALCLEQLGNIGKAAVAQQEALRLGRLSGYVVAEIVALANLGGFAVKLGAFSVAEQHFKTIERLIKSSHHINFSQKHVAIACLEASLFCLETGEYSNATSLFSKAARCQTELGERDCLAVQILAADIQLRFGRGSTALEILHRIPASETFLTPYFQVEKTLLESRIGTATKSELAYALQQSTNMGSVYQQCRLLLAIAANSEASERDSRLEILRKARVLSKKQSYRPLNAQCALLTGLMTVEAPDRSYRLSEALEMAEDLKLPELIAETSYWLALSQWELGEYLVAQKSLIRSTTLTNTLSQSVPQRYRRSYLAVSWRESASAKLGEWAQQIVSSVGRTRDLPSSLKDRQAGVIKALYGISISDGPALHSKLVNSIDETLHHRTTVVMIKHQGKTLWNSNRVKSIEDLRNRVSSLSEKSSNAPHFGHAIHDRGTAAWIPLQSQDVLGGIYVECSGLGDRLNEQELEFLTVVGALANAALSRIQTESVRAVKSESISEFHGIVGKSRAIRQVCHHIEIAAGNLATVLIEGESGTGKELVARAIHLCSGRSKGPFIPVDCGAIPETLIESELFGSRKGSFTGAIADRAGLFEAAHGGTLFLDEISNTSAGLQARLLRVIQEREVRRIGETKGRTVDVRLIVATNTNLDQLVKQKQFRQDLLFRLKVLHIPMPPLRNRREDIPQLVETFVAKLNATHRQKKHVTSGLLNQLSGLDYPGNVRELQNLVERAYAFTPGSAIVSAPVEEGSTSAQPRTTDETQVLFKDLIEGRKDFWTTVYARYKRRDISREKVQALVDLGLRSTRGQYKTLASMFRVKDKEYRRFMDFLRRNHCELDFRPYRKDAQ